jgi:hypothetical protein
VIPGQQLALRFDGPTYVAALDRVSLTSELHAVYAVMKDGQWRTPAEIVAAISTPGRPWSDSSVTARLRDLRKKRFGGFDVPTRRRTDRVHEYRVAEAQQ